MASDSSSPLSKHAPLSANDQATPSDAVPRKPRRRWLQVSLRTLLIVSALTLSMTILCGCSKDAPSTNASTVPNRPPALTPDNASPFTEEAAPNFDSKLTVEWPGTPEESRRRINAGQADETTIYSASVTQLGPVTIFSASVYEFSAEDLQGSDPKELLASHNTSGDEVELTRQEIKHGPNKHPGLDVTEKSDGSFRRRVNVMVGRRIYSVQVISLKQERLADDDVVKFFESFVVKD